MNTLVPILTTAPDLDAILPNWHDQATARHNVRAICDLTGLTLEQKNILSACVYQESQFLNWHADSTPVIHPNYAFHQDGTKYTASTDYGIVQVNDYWHIGGGKDFVSVDYVMSNPELCVRWMARYYKQHGHLNAWCSFTSGAYKQWLGRV